MAADNWRTCPRCAKIAEHAKAVKTKQANEAYGKVSADEFRLLAAEAEKPIKLIDTLREDYELGIVHDGLFKLRFSASCEACGYSFEYQHEEMTHV